MIKIFIITQNEPFYIPKMIKHLIDNQSNDYTVSGFSVLSPSRKNKSILDWFKERANIYSIWELIIVGFAFISAKILTSLKITSIYKNRTLFIKSGIQEIITSDINSHDFINQLMGIEPDIILSISCPQIFQNEILNIPKLYCINAHGTLLPRHRGVFGSFWTLYDGDIIAGSTLHTMELKLDAGKTLWQKSFPVLAKDTQYSIAYKTKKHMAFGLVELFNKIDSKSELVPVQSKYISSYHRAPSSKQGKELKQKGKRIVIISNLKLMLSKSF